MNRIGGDVLLKLASIVVTIALGAGAVAIGAGAPVSPARIARLAGDAARNLKTAEANTERAARDTEALATIAENVGLQLEASQRLLTIQLGIEKTSRAGVEGATTVVDRIDVVGKTLELLMERLQSVAATSDRITSVAGTARTAATNLQTTLNRLIARYEIAVSESRKLNRKARAYEELPP